MKTAHKYVRCQVWTLKTFIRVYPLFRRKRFGGGGGDGDVSKRLRASLLL
jgi:hypothetical protein